VPDSFETRGHKWTFVEGLDLSCEIGLLNLTQRRSAELFFSEKNYSALRRSCQADVARSSSCAI